MFSRFSFGDESELCRRKESVRTFGERLEMAQSGDRAAMVWVGNQYYSSTNPAVVSVDYEKAHYWYDRAATLGSAQADYFLSLMQEQGTGCQRDEVLSGRYCLQAARLGYPEAMFWTGIYFQEGSHGFEKSPATAYKYFQRARGAGFRHDDLDSLLHAVESGKDGEAVDELYPSNPRSPKTERTHSFLDIF